jgi:hypothetical protein
MDVGGGPQTNKLTWEGGDDSEYSTPPRKAGSCHSIFPVPFIQAAWSRDNMSLFSSLLAFLLIFAALIARLANNFTQ